MLCVVSEVFFQVVVTYWFHRYFLKLLDLSFPTKKSNKQNSIKQTMTNNRKETPGIWELALCWCTSLTFSQMVIILSLTSLSVCAGLKSTRDERLWSSQIFFSECQSSLGHVYGFLYTLVCGRLSKTLFHKLSLQLFLLDFHCVNCLLQL